MDKIILDLCGGTGAWSKPYKDNGYDVRIITLPEYDIRTYIPPENVYGILAAPPCTEFSLAKGSKPRNFKSAMEIVKACMQIIWSCRVSYKLGFWALENPLGFMRQFLGIPKYSFEQWEFGAPFIKKTEVWGYFKEPKPIAKIRPDLEFMMRYPNGKGNARCWSKPECPKEYQNLNLSRQEIRAITPAGFAKAFYKANK